MYDVKENILFVVLYLLMNMVRIVNKKLFGLRFLMSEMKIFCL